MFNKNDSKYALKWAKKIKAASELGGKCNKCGTSNIFVLEFHHLKNDKNSGISLLLDEKLSVVFEESKKCILLCKNCHSEEHFIKSERETALQRLKQKFLEYKGIFCCERCGYKGKNNASLVFHHRNNIEKEFKISYSLTTKKLNSTLEDRVAKELDKCSVLCANCHAIEHTKTEKFEELKSYILNKVDSYKEYKKIDAEYVKELFKKGMKRIDIARHLGCAKSSITHILG